MKSYLDILNHTLRVGQRQENRTGTDTFAVPNMHFSHEMSEGFPALTTKRIPFKTMATELEGFIKGITSKEWYSSRGCNIWNEWANPKKVENSVFWEWAEHQKGDPESEEGPNEEFIKQIQLEEDDLGPIYGYQWRRWNEAYDEDCDGQLEGVDQLGQVIERLKTNPNDRRLVVSAWNPSQIHMMALPPCHMMFVLTHINGRLSLHWTQRSCDLFLGVPFNIASYALLLELICKEVGMQPGNLSGMLCNCHIYENHIEQVREQLTRVPSELPHLSFKKHDWDGIFNWEATDCRLGAYHPQAAIKGDVAV
jgi:thymidylate synthase